MLKCVKVLCRIWRIYTGDIPLIYQNRNKMTNEIKIGDFIKGNYKYGCICGIVTEVKKSIVVIKECRQYYNEFTQTENLVNVTKSRIRQIGLNEGDFVK